MEIDNKFVKFYRAFHEAVRTVKDEVRYTSYDQILRVKKVVNENEPYYILIRNNGKDYFYYLSEDTFEKNPIVLKRKSLRDLGKIIGMLRAGILIKEGVTISEEDGFSERDIESFYDYYEKGYLEAA